MRKVILSLALIAVGFFNKEVNSAPCGSKTKGKCKEFCNGIFRTYKNCYYNNYGTVSCTCSGAAKMVAE